MKGAKLADVAKHTGRSLETVRTQLYSTMRKLDVSSQPELISKTLAMVQFFQDVSLVSKVSQHPYRRRADILREHGRTSEVFLAGDLSGDLVVVVPNVTMRTFPARMERQFAKRGLCVAALCRPGYGASNPAPNHQTTAQAYAEDYTALLDHLKVDRARILAQQTGCGFAVELAADLPDRVSDVVLLSALPPKSFLNEHQRMSPLARAFLRGMQMSPKLVRYLMYLSVRAWKLGGIRRVHGRQLAGFPPDFAALDDPTIVQEFDDAMRSRFAQDLESIAEDFAYSLRDWSDALTRCRVPITILHGTKDSCVSIEDVRKFAHHYTDIINLKEFQDTGFMLPYTRTTEFLDCLERAPAT